MLQTLLKTLCPRKVLPSGEDVIYAIHHVGKLEQREIEKAYTRLFNTEEGKKVLAHLQSITFHRALGPSVPEEQLRYTEGQRSLVATILRLSNHHGR